MNPQGTTAYQRIKQLGQISKPFGGATRYEASHPGIDIANKSGTPVPSFSQGTVVATDLGHANGENNFGNSVMIKDNNGNSHRYSHLKQAYVKVGQKIHGGQQIGQIGATGAAYSPSGGDPSHLDYRVMDAYGRYKNPLNYA